MVHHRVPAQLHILNENLRLGCCRGVSTRLLDSKWTVAELEEERMRVEEKLKRARGKAAKRRLLGELE